MEAYSVQFEQVQVYLAYLQALSPEELAVLCASIGIALPFLLFILKTLYIWLKRQLGLSKPTSYARLPSVLPWRSAVRGYAAFARWHEHVFKIGKQSSGGFASVWSVLTHIYHHPDKQIPLGLPWLYGASTYQFIGLSIATHLLCVGQSGGGKSVWLKTVAAMWSGSIVSIDPKGEFARDIYACKSTHHIVNLEPYAQDGQSGQINPFDCLEEAHEQGGDSAAIQWAYRIAQAFIETPPHSKQPFFTDASRGYLVGLILFVYASYPQEQRHLGTVRDLITFGLRVRNEDGTEESSREEAFKLLHKLMMESTAFGGAIAGAAAPFINAGKETLGNLQATIQERTKILDIPSVRHMLARTTRPLRELKTHGDFVLNVVAPVTSIREELKDLVRLITNLVMYTFEAEPNKNGQCLFLLDELNAQGYNGCVEAALPIARSMGLSIIAAIQDLEGLKAAYPRTYLSFVGNSDAVIWLSTSHPHNLEQLNRILGKVCIIQKDTRSGQTQRIEIDVAKPDQLMRFLSRELGNMIVTRTDGRAFRLKLDPHFKALPVWLYQPDPDHKEALLRRVTRFVCSPFIRKSQSNPSQETR